MSQLLDDFILSIVQNYDKLTMVIEMKKKFKEYRMFLVCTVIFIIFMILSGLWLFQQRITLVVGAFLLMAIDMILLVGRYKMILFDDMMIIYEWKILAMLPTGIEYKDIQSLEKKSKHHILIHHQRISSIYVMNADEFINTYQALLEKTQA